MTEPGAKGVAVIVAARNEADLIAATLAALRTALPRAAVWVADDASTDATRQIALGAGAEVISGARSRGKGANAGAAAWAVLGARPLPEIVLLCDGDLGSSAARLARLVSAIEEGECDLAVGAFSHRVGGGFGLALGFGAWAVRRLTGGLELEAPISGQRAMRAEVLRATLPFAHGFGMEIGMTIDAVRDGYRLGEYELDLRHRASGRSLGGFLHRARQLGDFVRVYLSRRRERP